MTILNRLDNLILFFVGIIQTEILEIPVHNYECRYGETNISCRVPEMKTDHWFLITMLGNRGSLLEHLKVQSLKQARHWVVMV